MTKKIDLSKIVSDMQKLYSKDKKATSLIATGDQIKTDYSESDGVPLGPTDPLRALLNLPVLPFNKIVQVAGNADTGKSTIGAQTIVQAQKAGFQVILWDSEDKFDASRLTMLGGDPAQILLVKTNEILKGAELSRRFINAVKEQDAEAKILFVWDSVGGSQSRSHAERELDNEKHAQPGQDAKENGQVMKTLVSLINKYPDTICIYLANQTYAKIGFMQVGDATSGGKKIEYHSSFIVMLKRIKTLTKTVKGVKTKYGIISRATVAKNHLSQSETSIHSLDFTISAKGATVSEEVIVDEDEE